MNDEVFNLFESLMTYCKDSYQFIINYDDERLVIDILFSEDDYGKIHHIIGERVNEPIMINIDKY